MPDHLPYGVALVLIGMVLTMNALSIGFRMYLRGRRNGRDDDRGGAGQDYAPAASSLPRDAPVKLEVRDLSISYEGKPALVGVNSAIRENEIFGIIGPANSGKTSFLKALNRMDMFNAGMNVTGEILFNGRNVRDWRNVYALRSRIGVVFPLPVGLPMTVYDNVALAPRLAGITKGRPRRDRRALPDPRGALGRGQGPPRSLGSLLSGGQQQRLTIARALSQEPELLMLDEFSIAVDPVTTMRIEDVLKELRHEMTIILVTNLTQQARRLADRTAFFLMGSCVEIGDTEASSPATSPTAGRRTTSRAASARSARPDSRSEVADHEQDRQ